MTMSLKNRSRSGASAAIVALGSVLATGLTYADLAPTGLRGDPAHGKTVYQVCMACHSLDEDDVGPRHRGVVGRRAGSVPGYAYSPALKSSGFVWDSTTLDRWLTNPQGLVPGTKMFFAMPSAQDRADVIAYLTAEK
jgi:cytochrome c